MAYAAHWQPTEPTNILDVLCRATECAAFFSDVFSAILIGGLLVVYIAIIVAACKP